jgi:elongator complex protein 3
MRAALLGYDPYKQVKARLKAFHIMKHPTDKIELIIMGGTFLSYPLSYQKWFVKRCYDALNSEDAADLEKAKKMNESAKHRCVALCIETRPDVCGKAEIKRMLQFGGTRCELGVQAIDNRIYRIVKRAHSVNDVVKATQLLRDAGFKIGYHIMPGLPGSSPQHDLRMFKELFLNENFKPDQLKIYPCQVVEGSLLVEMFEKGKYKPYSERLLVELIIKFLQAVPEYCRVMRVMREIPLDYLVAGTKRIDLRMVVDEEIMKKGIKVKEIRAREIGFALREGKRIDKNLKLKVRKYKAASGYEYFLEITNKDNILFALCRLRIPYKPFIPELKRAAILRELHVYGPAQEIGKRIKGRYQHHGFGRCLVKEAEKIAKSKKMKKIAVISGTGVREYYRKLGYTLKGAYMVKYLTDCNP